MVILRQKMRAKHDKSNEVTAALAAIIAPARATQGVIAPRHRTRPARP
jgi:quinol monooxygenase YgiN